MPNPLLPEVVLFSSTPALGYVDELCKLLSDTVRTRPWPEVVEPGHGVLEDVQAQLKRSDFAILFATPDTFTIDTARNEAVGRTVRQNVVIEMGLALGTLGRERVFVLHDKGGKTKLPTELDGFTYVEYDAQKSTELALANRAVAAYRISSGGGASPARSR